MGKNDGQHFNGIVVNMCRLKLAIFTTLPYIPCPLSSRWPNGMPSDAVLTLFIKETKMPKMKTKSSAKKRFSFTASGKVKSAQSGKRHGMIKRSQKFIRNQRGTAVLSEADARIVKLFIRKRKEK